MQSIQVRGCAVLLMAFALVACSPEVGSERWCTKLAEKPKGDWSANELKDYARHCLFKSQQQE